MKKIVLLLLVLTVNAFATETFTFRVYNYTDGRPKNGDNIYFQSHNINGSKNPQTQRLDCNGAYNSMTYTSSNGMESEQFIFARYAFCQRFESCLRTLGKIKRSYYMEVTVGTHSNGDTYITDIEESKICKKHKWASESVLYEGDALSM